jgi:hypothetical protein
VVRTGSGLGNEFGTSLTYEKGKKKMRGFEDLLRKKEEEKMRATQAV